MGLDLIFQLVIDNNALFCGKPCFVAIIYGGIKPEKAEQATTHIQPNHDRCRCFSRLSYIHAARIKKKTTADNGKQLCLLDDKSFLPQY